MADIDLSGMSDMQALEATLAAPVAAPVADVTTDDTPVDVGASIDSAIANEVANTPEAPVEAPVVDPVAAPAATPVTAPATPPLVDIGDGVTVAALNTKYKTSPEFKAWLDKDPEFKNQLFRTARRAERSDPYDELFQTPALAKEFHAKATDAYETQELFETDPGEFLKKLFISTAEKDASGNLVASPEGGYKTSGHFEKAMAVHRDNFYGSLMGIAEKLGDANLNGTDIPATELIEAIKIFQVVEGLLGFGKVKPQARPATSNQYPPDVQARLDELDRIKGSQANTSKNALDTFTAQATLKVDEALTSDIKALLDARLPKNIAMSEYTRTSIIKDTIAEVKRLATANKAHVDYLNRFLKTVPKDDSGIAKVIDYERGYARDIYPRILSKLLSENTKSVVAGSATAQQRVSSQLTRREIETSGGGANPARPDVRLKAQEAIEAARKSGKRPLTDMELLDAIAG